MRPIFLIDPTLLLLVHGLYQQALSDLSPRPPSGLSDDGNILGKNSAAQREVLDELQKLETAPGYTLYIILERSLISSLALSP